MCGPTLEGATVGIVGMGDIGCKIAQRIKSFDIGKLLYHNRSQRPEGTSWHFYFIVWKSLACFLEWFSVTIN